MAGDVITVVDEPNPTLARRELSRRLRALREEHGYSLSDMAKHLDVDLSTASRIDTGVRGVKADHLAKLVDWYGLDGSDKVSLTALAQRAARRGWWQQVKLPVPYRTLIGSEQDAAEIREFSGLAIPGLLQTEDYARAAIWASGIGMTPGVAEDALRVRLRRQRILFGDAPPKLWVLVDESALARQNGGAAVMARQLRHLVRMGQAGSAVVQVLGFERGLYPGGASHLVLVDPEDPTSGLVYKEDLTGSVHSTSAAELASSREIWTTLSSLALDPGASRARIESYISLLD